jgi:hypothetical protein
MLRASISLENFICMIPMSNITKWFVPARYEFEIHIYYVICIPTEKEKIIFMVITLESPKHKRSPILNFPCCYFKMRDLNDGSQTICPFRHIFKVCPCLTCCLQRHNNIVVHLVNVHLDMCTPQFHAFNIILQIIRFLVFG